MGTTHWKFCQDLCIGLIGLFNNPYCVIALTVSHFTVSSRNKKATTYGRRPLLFPDIKSGTRLLIYMVGASNERLRLTNNPEVLKLRLI